MRTDAPGAWRQTPAGKPRARGLGIPFAGVPGPSNAITDVSGVAVGYTTLIRGEGPLVVGQGPVRTGVTAILPRGREGLATPVYAGVHSLNGNGEMTGFVWIEEAGVCGGPITITNTHACGLTRDASIRWMAQRIPEAIDDFSLPVAAETYDGYLNDINGFHVTAEHVFAAIDEAAEGAIEEGSVGGGTGMIAYEFKGGSGSASREVAFDDVRYTLGVFVQANFGLRPDLTIAGVPVGGELSEGRLKKDAPAAPGTDGSIIAVVATDAPLMPHQLQRLAQRVGLGIARGGAVAYHGSGDIFLAFSTANEAAMRATEAAAQSFAFIPDPALDPLFLAVVQASEEAVVNAMVANETMTGLDGRQVLALPHGPLLDLLKRYGRVD